MRPRATWMRAELCDPPHRVTHPEKLQDLVKAFTQKAWSKDRPVLIGSWVEGFSKLQLITGSHRWAAAKRTGRSIPVLIIPYEKLREIWGLDAWVDLVSQSPTVQECDFS